MRTVLVGVIILSSYFALSSATVLGVPNPYSTIQAGLEASQAGDTVLVACGPYFESKLIVPVGVTLMGESDSRDCVDLIVLDDGPGVTLLASDFPTGDSYTTLERFQIQMGNPSVRVEGPCNLQIRNCAFERSVGNAIWIQSPEHDFVISNCTFIDCVARCISCQDCIGTLSIDNCLFKDNQYGCITARQPGTLLITNTIFHNNADDVGAVALLNYGCSIVFDQCTITHNSALTGSCVYVISSSLPSGISARNTIFSHHTGAPMIEGGYYYACGVTIQRCCFWENAEGNIVNCQTDDFPEYIEEDPQFCAHEGTDNLYLQFDSPCSPDNNNWNVLIGALPVACGPTSISLKTWTTLKMLY